MITSKEVKIKIPEKLTGKYIETELMNMGLDVLRWAIVNYDKDYYIVNVSIVEK